MRLGAIADNYRTFQRLAGPAAVAGVVKADGYGLGAEMRGAGAGGGRLRHASSWRGWRKAWRLRRVLREGAHLRAGWRARRCGAGADRPSV